MSTNVEKDSRAMEQARAQLDSIMATAKRHQHCQECSDIKCKLSSAEVFEGIGQWAEPGKIAYREARIEYHDEDLAREAITEDALEATIRSDWHHPAEEGRDNEYRILLCTGGPAVQITGRLDEHGGPHNAELQYQDWFTGWETLFTTGEEDEALMYYAEFFVCY